MSHPSFDLTGKSVVITGISRGIGRALALAFAEAGAHVTGCARSLDRARATTDEISARGGTATPAAADVTRPGDIDGLIATAVEAYGRLDVMVANAGIDITQPAIDFTADEFDAVIAGNLRSAFLCGQRAARRFIAQGNGGAIVFTSSSASYAGFDHLTPYCASKAGVDGLVRAMALEFGPHNIRVNAINPGYTNHQMNPASEGIMTDGEAAIVARTPLRRVGDVAEMAGPAMFLASDAASYVTGVCLLADGGWCAV